MHNILSKPEIPNITNKEDAIITPGKEETPVSILSDEFCEEQAFPHLLPKSSLALICIETVQ